MFRNRTHGQKTVDANVLVETEHAVEVAERMDLVVILERILDGVHLILCFPGYACQKEPREVGHIRRANILRHRYEFGERQRDDSLLIERIFFQHRFVRWVAHRHVLWAGGTRTMVIIRQSVEK